MSCEVLAAATSQAQVFTDRRRLLSTALIISFPIFHPISTYPFHHTRQLDCSVITGELISYPPTSFTFLWTPSHPRQLGDLRKASPRTRDHENQHPSIPALHRSAGMTGVPVNPFPSSLSSRPLSDYPGSSAVPTDRSRHILRSHPVDIPDP